MREARSNSRSRGSWGIVLLLLFTTAVAARGQDSPKANAYVPVMVDIKAPKADEFLSECKAALGAEELGKGVGFPFLAVLDADGKVVTAQRTDPLEVGDHHDPKLVKDFLAR